jgi:hypothetical protein
MKAFIATAQIWVSEKETIPLPIVGFFPDADAATKNAYAVMARAMTEDAPHLLEYPVTVVATELSDEAMYEFLSNTRRYRPDLITTPRGKVR